LEPSKRGLGEKVAKATSRRREGYFAGHQHEGKGQGLVRGRGLKNEGREIRSLDPRKVRLEPRILPSRRGEEAGTGEGERQEWSKDFTLAKLGERNKST